MSLSSVNTAIWNYLKTTSGITKLYQAAPARMLGDAWQSGGLPGTPAYLHIVDTTEDRVTLSAHGQKSRTYNVLVVCLYQWDIPNDLTTTATGDTDGWVVGQLALLDNLVSRIEADPAFGGNGSPIFWAGDMPSGIKTGRGEPVLDPNGGKVMAWCHVEFTVIEIVQL